MESISAFFLGGLTSQSMSYLVTLSLKECPSSEQCRVSPFQAGSGSLLSSLFLMNWRPNNTFPSPSFCIFISQIVNPSGLIGKIGCVVSRSISLPNSPYSQCHWDREEFILLWSLISPSLMQLVANVSCI